MRLAPYRMSLLRNLQRADAGHPLRGYGTPIEGRILSSRKYIIRNRRPPSQTWKTFLKNHMGDLVSADFFVVPTATFRLLFVFLILSHDRRRPVHFAVTANPTTEWVAHQLLDAFPWDSAPRYLLRDRDGSYGRQFSEAAECLNLQEVLTAPRSPWQNAYVERLIGSIRRECLNHVIVLRESGLRRILRLYFEYYERSRTHLSLGKDAPIPRTIQPRELGRVVELPQVEDFTTDTNDERPERVPLSSLHNQQLIGQTCLPAQSQWDQVTRPAILVEIRGAIASSLKKSSSLSSCSSYW